MFRGCGLAIYLAATQVIALLLSYTLPTGVATRDTWNEPHISEKNFKKEDFENENDEGNDEFGLDYLEEEYYDDEEEREILDRQKREAADVEGDSDYEYDSGEDLPDPDYD